MIVPMPYTHDSINSARKTDVNQVRMAGYQTKVEDLLLDPQQVSEVRNTLNVLIDGRDVSSLSNKQCQIMLDDLHQRSDNAIRSALNTAGIKSVSQYGMYSNSSRAKEKILILKDKIDQTFLPASPVPDHFSPAINHRYEFKATQLELTTGKPAGQLLEQLNKCLEQTTSNRKDERYSPAAYREAFSNFHGGCRDTDRHSLNEAGFKPVRWSPAVRAKFKVLALQKELAERVRLETE